MNIYSYYPDVKQKYGIRNLPLADPSSNYVIRYNPPEGAAKYYRQSCPLDSPALLFI